MNPLDHAGTVATFGVVAYRRPAQLARLLDGVRGCPLDVVVVNVGGDASVSAVVRRHSGAREICVDNRGFAAGVNEIAKAARSDVVVFTNDDVELDPPTLVDLAAAIRRDGYDVAVPRLVDPSGVEEGSVRALPTLGRLFAEWAVLPDRPLPVISSMLKVEKWRRPRGCEGVAAATAAVVAVRTLLVLEEPMPESYFLYWEEMEWFWRLRRREARVVMLGERAATRIGGRTEHRPEKSGLLARNAVRCVRRTQGRLHAAVAVPIVVLWQLRLAATTMLRLAAGKGDAAHPSLRCGAAGIAAAAGSWRELR